MSGKSRGKQQTPNKKNQAQTPTGTQLNKKPTEEKQVFITDEELQQIWDVLGSLPKDEAAKFLKEFPAEIIEKLRTHKNPYKLPVFKGNDKRLLIFTTIPLSETYARRFAMTSLIGYTFRMVDEYKPQLDLPKEDDPSFQTVFNTHLKKLEIARPYKEFDRQLRETQALIKCLEELLQRPEEDRPPTYNADNEQNWDSMTPQQLSKLLLEHQKQHAELTAGRLMYEYHINANDISNLEIKLIGMNKKKLECEALVDNVDDAVRKFTEELGKLERLYSQNPELEPDETVPKQKVRSETNEPQKDRSRAEVRRTIEVYTTKLSEYRAELDKTIAQITEITDRIASLQSANTVHKQSLNAQKMDYYNRFGNQNDPNTKPKRPKGTAPPKAKKAQKTRPAWYSVFAHVVYQDYDLIDEDYEEARRLAKEQLGIRKTYEERVEKMQKTISDFLQEHFRYNPDLHVSCSYKPNYDDPQRTPLEVDEHRRITEQKYERSILPPDDTFFRWQRYADNNYEELRQATDDIYCEKSDMELNIVPMEIIEEDDPEVGREKALAFCRKYRNEFEAEPRVAAFRVNNLLGSWQQNRERIDFYNENTEIIKRIIDQHKKDSKLGPQLMKDRVERKRDKNIQVAGKNDKDFQEFRKNTPASKLEKIGTSHVSEITEKDIPRDQEAARENELEVGVHVIKPVRHGRRLYGQTKQSHFNIPAEDPNPNDTMTLQSASDRKKDFIDGKAGDEDDL